jgi:hypothetical protein
MTGEDGRGGGEASVSSLIPPLAADSKAALALAVRHSGVSTDCKRCWIRRLRMAVSTAGLKVLLPFCRIGLERAETPVAGAEAATVVCGMPRLPGQLSR